MDINISFEERASDLVSRMTLEEKVSQMLHESPAIERLGVPKYNWWNECLHGVGRAGLATVFPQAIGMGAMWDDNMMLDIAKVVSDEARAKHHEFVRRGKRGYYQGLTFWTPNINIFRDPRWGRGMETYGEDPFLTGEMAVNYINGLQGDDPDYLKLVATAKHFVVHSGPEPDRHRFNAAPSERDFYETYLPHFKKSVFDGNVYSVMCAYNRLYDQPCCGSQFLENLLRGEWGFDGYIVSDCWAVRDFYREGDHEVVETVEQASAKAVKAGTDLNCGNSYPALVDAVEQGLVSEDEIDKCVERLMLARMKLGMFDLEEMVPYATIPYDVVDSEPHRKMALEAARKSMVLLKNEDKVLPFSKNMNKVAVIGPNANRQDVLLANYNGYPSESATPLEGIREKLSASEVVYAPGTRLADEFPLMDVIPSDYLFVSEDLQEHGLRAEYYNNPELEGDAAVVKTDSIIDFVWWTNAPEKGLEYDDFSVRWTGYLVPPVSGEYAIGGEGYRAFKVLLDNEVMGEWDVVHHPHMEYEKIVLEAGRSYKIFIEYRQWEVEYPNMKLLWDIPGRDLEKEAMEIAKESDAIVMCMGLSPFLEGEEMKVKVDGFAGGDRVDIGLPDSQSRLIKAIMKLNKPTVLVLLNGSALAINWEAEHVPAILEAWYPGQAGGTAIADILFGDYNPAGRLPLTFYKTVDDLPPFDEYGMDGRTYKYFEGEPIFAFGHGLSYSTFKYSNLKFPDEYVVKDHLDLSVTVSNEGAYDGEEVVQVYASYPGHEGAPLNVLCGFKRVFLKSGEERTVNFSISPDDFAIYDPEKRMSVPVGNMQFSVGGHQPDAESVNKGQVLVADIRMVED